MVFYVSALRHDSIGFDNYVNLYNEPYSRHSRSEVKVMVQITLSHKILVLGFDVNAHLNMVTQL